MTCGITTTMADSLYVILFFLSLSVAHYLCMTHILSVAHTHTHIADRRRALINRFSIGHSYAHSLFRLFVRLHTENAVLHFRLKIPSQFISVSVCVRSSLILTVCFSLPVPLWRCVCVCVRLCVIVWCLTPCDRSGASWLAL